MVVVGDDGESMKVAEGLVANAAHWPVPVAAIVAVELMQIDWSGPAFGTKFTLIYTVPVSHSGIGEWAERVSQI